MRSKAIHSSSFRDPSGYVFLDEGKVKRQINPIYFSQYDALNSSGFYQKLFKNQLLIPHLEISRSENQIIIQPEQLPFVTYPYEWCFNQYKEAALLTLKLQKYCLQHDFSLKDASAFNVAFHRGKAVFIDTLSIDFYDENKPWRAYKQFISHFLGPLLIAHFHGAQMLSMMRDFSDGIPTKTIASLLPTRTKLNPFLYTNIHLLAKFERKHNDDEASKMKATSLSKNGQIKILDALYNHIKKLGLKESSEWGNYYEKTNYSDVSFQQKTKIINSWLKTIRPKSLIDIGGNDGTFVRTIEDEIDMALVGDIDNNAVDTNYSKVKKQKETHILPFLLDVLNPTPGIGFNNKERDSIVDRLVAFKPDVSMALALIHHMSLSGNVPFEMSAEFFAKFSNYLIIEFPKRTDSKVDRLLNTKGEFKDHFDFYNESNFEKAFSYYFEILKKEPIEYSERILYLLKVKHVQ